MNRRTSALRIPSRVIAAILVAIALCFITCARTASPKLDYAVFPVSYKNVQVTDAFWTPRLENNRNVSIPAMFDRYDRTGRSPDLRLIEAACYVLAQIPIPGSEAGWTAISTGPSSGSAAGSRSGPVRGTAIFLRLAISWNLGVAYYEATGSRKLLDVAIEIADDLDAVFGPDKRHDISNHEGIKIGLIRLYRATGDDRYLRLARFFLDTRGNPAGRSILYGPYAQDHEPVKSQTRAIGHAVRATYLYTPLTDIAALTGDPEYAGADERIWE